MDNIKKADKIIEDYKKLRLFREKKNAFNLHGKLEKLGFTEESLANKKREVYIKSLDIVVKETNEDDFLETKKYAIENKIKTLIFLKPTKPIIYTSFAPFNREYCEEKGLKIIQLDNRGGTIVTSGDDLGIALVLDKDDLTPYLREKIETWIRKNFTGKVSDSLVKNHNDTLIEGYKVSACGRAEIDEMFISYYQISFKVDLETIKKVCTKKMKKIPKGLNDFGDKTREDLIIKVKEWLL